MGEKAHNIIYYVLYKYIYLNSDINVHTYTFINLSINFKTLILFKGIQTNINGYS